MQFHLERLTHMQSLSHHRHMRISWFDNSRFNVIGLLAMALKPCKTPAR
jgi:hypothetical protein